MNTQKQFTQSSTIILTLFLVPFYFSPRSLSLSPFHSFSLSLSPSLPSILSVSHFLPPIHSFSLPSAFSIFLPRLEYFSNFTLLFSLSHYILYLPLQHLRHWPFAQVFTQEAFKHERNLKKMTKVFTSFYDNSVFKIKHKQNYKYYETTQQILKSTSFKKLKTKQFLLK